MTSRRAIVAVRWAGAAVLACGRGSADPNPVEPIPIDAYAPELTLSADSVAIDAGGWVAADLHDTQRQWAGIMVEPVGRSGLRPAMIIQHPSGGTAKSQAAGTDGEA